MFSVNNRHAIDDDIMIADKHFMVELSFTRSYNFMQTRVRDHIFYVSARDFSTYRQLHKLQCISVCHRDDAVSVYRDNSLTDCLQNCLFLCIQFTDFLRFKSMYGASDVTCDKDGTYQAKDKDNE
ncbi:hypothetical protein D3C85_1202130 [compost metagenome]